MQAIVTKYLGPTDHKGARVKARAFAGSVTIPWDYALGAYENHLAAARALCVKAGWDDEDGQRPLTGADMPRSDGGWPDACVFL